MKKIKRNRIIAIFMSLCIAFCMNDMGTWIVDVDASDTYTEIDSWTDLSSGPGSVTINGNSCTVCKVASGNYKLVGDISLSWPLCIEAGSTVTFILDGYKIFRGGGTSQTWNGMVICNFGELTLGSETSTSGIITGGSAANGGGVYMYVVKMLYLPTMLP